LLIARWQIGTESDWGNKIRVADLVNFYYAILLKA
jgi:hypothetical protein